MLTLDDDAQSILNSLLDYLTKNNYYGNRHIQDQVSALVNYWGANEAFNNKSVNGLNPPQIELLALLAEECGETVQAVCKILRHGYKSNFEGKEYDNKRILEKEIGHIFSATKLLCNSKNIKDEKITTSKEDKLKLITKYLHHRNIDYLI